MGVGACGWEDNISFDLEIITSKHSANNKQMNSREGALPTDRAYTQESESPEHRLQEREKQ